MLRRNERSLDNVPVGSLGVIPLVGCEAMGDCVNDYLVKWRKDSDMEGKNDSAYIGYDKDSFIINAKVPRFGSGEAKGIILESVRGKDLYLMVDVCNYSLTYSLTGHTNHMSPDDHFQNLKRIIAAVGGKARRINVIMPFLYESRQHKRSSRESLDCALALQELVRMGVDNIITFDAHDPRVQNAIPLSGFETVSPTYQLIKGLLRNVPDINIHADHMMVISPDEGATSRAIYMANVLGVDMGMFYKRRDYTQIIDGRNPIVAHEFLGTSVEGKDVIIVDDMISSGESILDVARQLKARKANRIFAASTFGLFTNGLDIFDKAYEEGLLYRVLTTNLVYQTPELLSKPYYINCNMSKYIALIIDTLNHDASLSEVLSPLDRIHNIVNKYNNGESLESLDTDIY
ncbi:MAG: ribose-phosphate pyrophosphokinase [Eubacteriales bacterium]